ncbi:MAG: glycosylase [Planctomycetota bacterium]
MFRFFSVLAFVFASCTGAFVAVSANDGDDEGDTPGSVAFPEELVRWTPAQANPVFAGTALGTWDDRIRERGCILRHGGKYHLWYTGYRGNSRKKLGHAVSLDGLRWERDPDNPIFEESWTEDVHVVHQDGTFSMVAEGRGDRAHLLTSADGLRWTDHGRLDLRSQTGVPISPGPFGTPTLWFEGKTWYLFYERGDRGIWLAQSTDQKTWTNVQDEPVISCGPAAYDRHAVALNQVIRYRGL